MAGFARLEVLGHLGKDAEMNFTQSGTARCTFSIAVNSRVPQGQPEKTQWIRVTLLGKRAEALTQYLVKGKQVYVRGDFEYRSYVNKDGQPGYSLDVLASEVELLGARTEGQASPTTKPAAAEWDALADGEVPF